MIIMYSSALALVLSIVGMAYYSRMAASHAEEIRRLERQMAACRTAQSGLESEIAALAASEQALLNERIALVAASHDLPALGGASADAGGASLSVVEYLLKSGRITEDSLRKAREFKVGSKSPFGLEEILVMMDVITSEEMKSAQAKVASGGQK